MTQPTDLLADIAAFCGRHGLAESTFGRLAVNDGKFVPRLRAGGRVRHQTLVRVQAFLALTPVQTLRSVAPGRVPLTLRRLAGGSGSSSPSSPSASSAVTFEPIAAGMTGLGLTSTPEGASGTGNFRFYDNRQKYLLFVNTCSEKSVIARRVGLELAHLRPRPPAIRLFDAGVGDGTVLARVMREMHRRFATLPFYIVGKEISLEDVRLTLEKMPDRFFEHPASVLVLTNLSYAEAPWLLPRSPADASSMVWHEVALKGTTAHEFEQQITDLDPFLTRNWTVRASPITGNPLHERPVVLVIYRDDYRFLLDDTIARRGAVRADYDLVMASQPYRLRVPLSFKADRVLAPLARSLGPGGRLLGIHARGADPGLDLVQRIWPGENPYTSDRHDLLKALKTSLGTAAQHFNFNAYADERSIFRYDMHTLPTEIGNSIGTSTLFAAWNAAVYVAQIEDQRLNEVLAGGRYLEVTREVLREYGGLWFQDESYVVSRPRA